MEKMSEITEIQKIILEIMLEHPEGMNQDDLVNEALKRQQRIKQLGDMK